MKAARIGVAVGLVGWAIAAGGGTCEEPPPWHDVSGAWVNASWGPARVMVEGVGEADVDVGLIVEAATPTDRRPNPVRGEVCVRDGAALGIAGVYAIDEASSTWAGSDYGGARLDVVARHADGRVIEVTQAFMHNASPERLDNAILIVSGADGATRAVMRFEDFRRDAAATSACAP